jgi:hypothetical protein
MTNGGRVRFNVPKMTNPGQIQSAVDNPDLPNTKKH